MRLIQMDVVPVHCQVTLYVPDAEQEPPLWPTGREAVVANSGTIYVNTICDVDGTVAVEVWSGEVPAPLHDLIYEGFLQVRDAGAFVGSYTGNQLGALVVPEGEHRVRVYAAYPHADHVIFVLD